MDSEYPFSIFWSLCCLIYRFWLLLWYLLVIVLSDIQILICPLVSFGHCVVCYADSDYLWFLLVIVLSDIQILIAPLVSFGHCVVWYTDSDCPFGILWPLYCLLYRFWLLLWYLLVIVLSDIQTMIVPLVSFGHCVVWYTDSDFPFGIFWSLCFLIYRFWFPLWYLLAIMLSVIQILITHWYLLVIVLSDIQILIIPFGFFWSLCCLIYRFWFPLWYLLVIVFSDIQISITLWYLLVIVLYVIQILIAPLIWFGHCVVLYRDSDCPFGIFWSICCLIYRFWLPLWYLLVIVLSVIQILISPLVSFGHCVVWYTDSDFPSGIFWSLCCLIYRFWFPLWFLLVIVLSDIQILISPLVSFGHFVVWYTDYDYPLVSFGQCVV